MRKTDEDTHQLFQDNAAPRLSNSRFDVALPSYEIRRDNGKQYIAYRVAVSLHGQSVVERWRRYSHFETLHDSLVSIGQGSSLPLLPPKTCSWRHAFDAREFVERRKRSLEDYLLAVRKLPGCTSAPVLDSFLGLGHDSVGSDMRVLSVTVVQVRHLSPVFNPSLCSLSTGTQSFCATYVDNAEDDDAGAGQQNHNDNDTITHNFVIHSDFLGRLKQGETDLQIVFEDFSGKHRCGTTIDIGSLGGGWRSRPLVAARQAFITGQMPEDFALDTWLVLSGVDDGEVHLIIHGQQTAIHTKHAKEQQQIRQQEDSKGLTLPWASIDVQMLREDEMARKKLEVSALVQHKRHLTEDQDKNQNQVQGLGETKSNRNTNRNTNTNQNNQNNPNRQNSNTTTTTNTPTDQWFQLNLPQELVDEYNYKVRDVRDWIRTRQYLLCRGERQIDRWHRFLAATKPSFHDVNGWHCNDRRLRVLTYGGIPSALCVAFHPEILTFRNGIFSTLRPTLWKLFSGANRLRQTLSSSSLNYHTLCKVESHKDWIDHGQTDHAHFLLASLQFDQIELDITRTEETITGAETAALRRILRAFCLRNPKVGYCQAMNFVAISLLRAARTGSLSEEDAFWLLSAVCEEIVPYYYVKDMSGVKAATNILTGLVKKRFPRLNDHLNAMHFPLELFSIPWLCSLFSSSFPAETVYRIWDALFLNGADTLFYCTMAFLRMNENALLSFRGMMEANQYIKQRSETLYDVETLMEIALEERNACSDEVARLRKNLFSEESDDESLRKNLATKSASDLVRSTPLHRSDIETLLGDLMFARQHTNKKSMNVSSIELNPREFQKCIDQLLSNLGRSDPRISIWRTLAWETFSTFSSTGTRGDTRSVNLQSFSAILSLFHRGSDVTERLTLCYAAYDCDQKNSIGKKDLLQVIGGAYKFFCPQLTLEEVNTLASKVISDLGISRTQRISFDRFSKIMLSVPVLSDLVRDEDGVVDHT